MVFVIRLPAVLSQVFKKALVFDCISKNPLNGVTIPKYETQTKRALNTLEKEAIIKIDTFCNKEKLFLYLGLYAGLRRGESLALTVQDINFETNEISINKTLQYTKNNPIVKNGTKTEAGIRIIPLVEPLRECLKSYCQYYHNDYLFMTTKNYLRKLHTTTCGDKY